MDANITNKSCTVKSHHFCFTLHHVSVCMGVLRYFSCNIYGGAQLDIYTLVQMHNTGCSLKCLKCVAALVTVFGMSVLN